MSTKETIKQMLSVDIFKKGKTEESFMGRPFYLDYNFARLVVADSWKNKVGGIPQGAFLLAFYEGESDVQEALLLRALRPTKLPTDDTMASSMVEFYKEASEAKNEEEKKIDEFTRYEFSFSGLECRVLGTFYKGKDGKTVFGADVENFYSANHYKAYKPAGDILREIVNFREAGFIPENETEKQIGVVQYSSSIRFQQDADNVPISIYPADFLGKRSALFGMTRTGKSNTVKIIIQASVEMSKNAKSELDKKEEKTEDVIEPFDEKGFPKYPVGQIIFDINGEYANANLQDEGTAIFDLYKKDTIRYSVMEKKQESGFKVLKVNFYNEIESGFDMIRRSLAEDASAYIRSLTAIDLTPPENYKVAMNNKTSDERKAAIKYDRKKAAYYCCLYAAGFKPTSSTKKIKFYGDTDTINKIVPNMKPHEGLTLEQGIEWFTAVYNASGDKEHEKKFEDYKNKKETNFIDEDLSALLVFLTRRGKPGGSAGLSGFRLLNRVKHLHTDTAGQSFEDEIVSSLRLGKIVIIDLSQGNPETQKIYSERICTRIFQDSMNRFVHARPNNFIQFYFEEAHNLFPKKDDKDLNQIYNRIAKEGAKLNIGLLYATQEVSSISANILKNTQNWFIAHLNNEDEIRELKKYYDFTDFAENLVKFSAATDKGFVRMKTYSSPFVIPVKIAKFTIKEE